MRYRRKQRQDSQRLWPGGQCGRCGRELYPGESCWHINGILLCKSCLLDYALGFFAPHREEVGR